MANGYYNGHMAVEMHGGEWVLRARLPSDLPTNECPEADAAMSDWKRRNGVKFEAQPND